MMLKEKTTQVKTTANLFSLIFTFCSSYEKNDAKNNNYVKKVNLLPYQHSNMIYIEGKEMNSFNLILFHFYLYVVI